MICDNCGRNFETGNTDGLPNGVAFALQDGRMITMCQRCLIDLGELTQSEKAAILEKLTGKEGTE